MQETRMSRRNPSAKPRKPKKQKRRVKIWPFFVIPFLLLIVAMGVFGFLTYRNIASAADTVYTPITVEQMRETPVALSANQPVSIMLLQMEGESLLSADIATINPRMNTTIMKEIPLTAHAEIIGHDGKAPIIQAHQYGGVELLINTVQNFLNIPIDYFVEISGDGVNDLLNLIGGLDPNQSISVMDVALNFADLDLLRSLPEMLEVAQGDLRTNLSMEEMMLLAMNYRNATAHLEQFALSPIELYLEGSVQQIVGDSDLATAQAILASHLGVR